jgi:UDP-3-O-[3-hydroxymyristoyl] glucosamine N-acyltransferase
VVIGDNALLFCWSKIYPETHYRCTAIIHSGAIIDSDGFVLHQIQMERTPKFLKLGNVIIEDNVDIGSWQ